MSLGAQSLFDDFNSSSEDEDFAPAFSSDDGDFSHSEPDASDDDNEAASPILPAHNGKAGKRKRTDGSKSPTKSKKAKKQPKPTNKAKTNKSKKRAGQSDASSESSASRGVTQKQNVKSEKRAESEVSSDSLTSGEAAPKENGKGKKRAADSEPSSDTSATRPSKRRKAGAPNTDTMALLKALEEQDDYDEEDDEDFVPREDLDDDDDDGDDDEHTNGEESGDDEEEDGSDAEEGDLEESTKEGITGGGLTAMSALLGPGNTYQRFPVAIPIFSPEFNAFMDRRIEREAIASKELADVTATLKTIRAQCTSLTSTRKEQIKRIQVAQEDRDAGIQYITSIQRALADALYEGVLGLVAGVGKDAQPLGKLQGAQVAAFLKAFKEKVAGTTE
ncbi:uncharacterized protein EV422DRAFT_520808 [Fimicolochytrium jonesii]|uniref:uncharacterized protein n=1 Tax=Fimicolochytrium jonesii TaxID=1396493 RepID=UPI0022FE3CE3|nr:uncharacterized protein EV422DRAFT_520808 [Fimicolochytrium jonesii]KAI8823372.1 hypothetical protein EV422DRAFT_520808 [Fimicolochytrium jonesii]